MSVVYIVDTGDYEQNYIYGVYATRDAAIDDVIERNPCGNPRWSWFEMQGDDRLVQRGRYDYGNPSWWGITKRKVLP